MEQMSTEPRLSAYLHARACAKGIPLAGNFELTARCNFNCRMCYVHLTPEEQRRRGAELTADEWLAIAEQARSQGMLFLLLTGGAATRHMNGCAAGRCMTASCTISARSRRSASA